MNAKKLFGFIHACPHGNHCQSATWLEKGFNAPNFPISHAHFHQKDHIVGIFSCHDGADGLSFLQFIFEEKKLAENVHDCGLICSIPSSSPPGVYKRKCTKKYLKNSMKRFIKKAFELKKENNGSWPPLRWGWYKGFVM
jgi:hypothetical protein